MGKKRLDVMLVEAGLFPTRSAAQAAIMEGRVRVNDSVVTKCGTLVSPSDRLSVERPARQYVSRGGIKLEGALREFGVSVAGKVCLDAGSSTGGFVDCLLQHGAAKVFAVDVGYGQLAWKLRQDPRVVAIERTNVRYLTIDQLGTVVDLATLDVSFISLTKVWPAVKGLLKPGGETLSLVKPQFEAGPSKVGKRGVVKDPEVHLEVLVNLIGTGVDLGFEVEGVCASPIKGPEGNLEFWLYLKVPPAGLGASTENIHTWLEKAREVVRAAHER
ncbi:MAG: TlyA family RNA methyltransferase [Bacillota bacterium]